MCLKYECCCCFSLRPGLYAWGYIKLALILVYIITCTNTRIGYTYGRNFWSIFDERAIQGPGPIIWLILETASTILLVVAAHMKHLKMYQGYFIYSLVRLGFSVFAWIMFLVAFQKQWGSFQAGGYIGLLVFVALYIGVHIYFFSIEKSVLFKLQGKLVRPNLMTAAAAPTVNQSVVVNTQSIVQPGLPQGYMQPMSPYQAGYPAPGQAGMACPPNSVQTPCMPQNMNLAAAQQPAVVSTQPQQGAVNTVPECTQNPPPYDYNNKC